MSKLIKLPDQQEEIHLNNKDIVLIVDKLPVALIVHPSHSLFTCNSARYIHPASGLVNLQIAAFIKRYAAINMGEIPQKSLYAALNN